MATKPKAAAPSGEVTVPRSVLKQFVELVEGLEAADAAYKSCQHGLFRAWAHGAYRAPTVQAAYEAAKGALAE